MENFLVVEKSGKNEQAGDTNKNLMFDRVCSSLPASDATIRKTKREADFKKCMIKFLSSCFHPSMKFMVAVICCCRNTELFERRSEVVNFYAQKRGKKWKRKNVLILCKRHGKRDFYMISFVCCCHPCTVDKKSRDSHLLSISLMMTIFEELKVSFFW